MFAITGSIGTGKSTISNIIKSLGYEIIDCDEIVHKLYQENDVILKIEKLFPNVIENKTINRKKLGQIIFNNSEEKKKLESLIHPLVRNKIKNKGRENRLIFVEVPLLYESKMEDMFVKVICVACDKDIQVKRIMARNNISKEETEKIIASQMPIEEKIRLADFVIYNNGDINKLIDETKKIINSIITNS